MSCSNEGKTQYLCSIYTDRPETCRKYPWNFANQIFTECQFVDDTVKPVRLRTKEEQLTLNTEEEIQKYCVECGRCCFFGPAQCSMLRIVEMPTKAQEEQKKSDSS